jgi:hypothetical protein
MAPDKTEEWKDPLEFRAHDRAPLPRHEILWMLRYIRQEAHFRQLLQQVHGKQRLVGPTVSSPFSQDIMTENFDQLRPMNIGHADDCCNKTAPFYCFHVERPDHILKWLHRKWRVPWRSHIEWGQFIAKIIIVRNTGSSGIVFEDEQQMEPRLAIDRIIHLHALICQQSETVRRKVAAEKPEERENKPFEKWGLAEYDSPRDLQQDQVSGFFQLRPLFRAVAVLIHGRGEYTRMKVHDHGVYVIRTGVTEGLSAPIPLEDLIEAVPTENFDTDLFWVKGTKDWVLKAVKTTPPVAYDFLDKLQQREDAVFGQQPDPVESTKNSRAGYLMSPGRLGKLARGFGWEDDWDLPSGPSAEWVPDGMTVSWAPDMSVPGSSSRGESSANRATGTD